MIFRNIFIKNFRNFEEMEIELSNNNIIFGMNDTGKTNFLYALRYIFDYKMRNKGFQQSDFFQNDKTRKIEILLEIDISDINKDNTDIDTELLIAAIGGNRLEENIESIYIKLESVFDEKELFGDILLYWGSDKKHLFEIKSYGQRTQLDSLFNAIYMSPNIDLQKYYKQNKRHLITLEDLSSADEKKKTNIDRNIEELNSNVSQLEIVKHLEQKLTKAYKRYRKEPLNIEIKSEISINGPLNDLIPYIKWDSDDDNYYPTSGDGRKKILSYALNHLVSEKINQNKIPIYLIEEPENSLHRSMQIGLSKQLFSDQLYKHFFVTTHSPEILYEMDDTQLIRINNENKQNAESTLYNVPTNLKNMKKQLNKGLANSIFYDKVLLVEGGSEYVLFETILNNVIPDYEIKGNFLLQVDGIDFKPYVDIYEKLGIDWMVKTDNDLKKNSAKGNINKYDVQGFNRALSLIGEKTIGPIVIKDITEDMSQKDKENSILKEKKELYKGKKETVQDLKDMNIYLPEVDLENELYDILTEIEIEDNETLLNKIENKLEISDLIKYLQSSKLINMITLCENLEPEYIDAIYENWDVLKEFVKNE